MASVLVVLDCYVSDSRTKANAESYCHLEKLRLI